MVTTMKMWQSELSVFCCCFLFIMAVKVSSHRKPEVPCFFIFGDSLSDNGNNNVLNTVAKVNYPPYGIDFPGGKPTGRFTNGRTAVDIIGQHLGLDFIPPHINASSVDISKGLNYASGAAGILCESGYMLGERITMDQQLLNHLATISELALMKGSKIFDHLSKCVYYVNIGSNDYVNNYFSFQLGYWRRYFYTPERYATLLIERYAVQLKALHSYGSRKFLVSGLGACGCAPVVVLLTTVTSKSGCVDLVNDAVRMFNTKLKSLIDELNQEFTDSKFVMLNSYDLLLGLSSAEGFKHFYNSSCCVAPRAGLCQPEKAPCPNRSEYIFWDIFHPSDKANAVMVGQAYSTDNRTITYPINIRSLAKL